MKSKDISISFASRIRVTDLAIIAQFLNRNNPSRPLVKIGGLTRVGLQTLAASIIDDKDNGIERPTPEEATEIIKRLKSLHEITTLKIKDIYDGSEEISFDDVENDLVYQETLKTLKGDSNE